MKSKSIALESRPHGTPTESNFRLSEVDVPAPQDGQVLLKSLYLSVDPYMRGRMSDAKSYVAPFEVGKPLEGGVVAEVIESQRSQFPKGALVLGNLPWQEYNLSDGKGLTPIDAQLAPASYYLGILGMPGLTAYFGLLDIGQPQAGETVVVSGAAGAVGSVVGQIAKIRGARVVGIAGSDDKVNYLKEELGFDEAINYKTATDIKQALSAACPKGIDVYFDNVGGDITDAVYDLINKSARIILCGQISLYNETDVPMGPRVETKLLKSSALMKGFIVTDYHKRWPEGIQALGGWLKEGRLKYAENTIEGFEKAPQAFLGLFKGENKGKQLVKVAEPAQQSSPATAAERQTQA